MIFVKDIIYLSLHTFNNLAFLTVKNRELIGKRLLIFPTLGLKKSLIHSFCLKKKNPDGIQNLRKIAPQRKEGEHI